MEKRAKGYRIWVLCLKLGIAGLVIFGVFFLCKYSGLQSKESKIETVCEELTDFVWVHGEERTPITLPGSVSMDLGRPVVLERVLPQEIPDGMWINYYTGTDSQVMVGDEIRTEFVAKYNTLPGGVVKSVNLFIKLYPEDGGKTLTIVRNSNDYNGKSIHSLYYGTGLGLVERVVRRSSTLFIFSVSLVATALITLMIGMYLRLKFHIDASIISIGLGMLCVALWQIFDSNLFQFVFQRVYVDGTMSFLMMMILPYPFVDYVNRLQKKRYEKVYVITCSMYFICSIFIILLHMLEIVDFYSALPVVYLFLAIVMGGTFFNLFVDFRKNRCEGYQISFYGLLGFLICSIIEILLILSERDRVDGSMLMHGLFWLLALSLLQQFYAIKEAQDLSRNAILESDAKSRILSELSHDMRTPMSTILGMGELIMWEGKGNIKITKYVGDLLDAGNELMKIIDNLSEFEAENVAGDEEHGRENNESVHVTNREINRETNGDMEEAWVREALNAANGNEATGKAKAQKNTTSGNPSAHNTPAGSVLMVLDAKVLVVDDNEMNLLVIKGFLDKMRLVVDTATSGEEALEKIAHNCYQIIFLDQMMPGMDGIETLSHIRENPYCTEVPVIALTADTSMGAKEFYIDKGFSDYLSKPFSSSILYEQVRQYLPDRFMLDGPGNMTTEPAKDTGK